MPKNPTRIFVLCHKFSTCFYATEIDTDIKTVLKIYVQQTNKTEVTIFCRTSIFEVVIISRERIYVSPISTYAITHPPPPPFSEKSHHQWNTEQGESWHLQVCWALPLTLYIFLYHMEYYLNCQIGVCWTDDPFPLPSILCFQHTHTTPFFW